MKPNGVLYDSAKSTKRTFTPVHILKRSEEKKEEEESRTDPEDEGNFKEMQVDSVKEVVKEEIKKEVEAKKTFNDIYNRSSTVLMEMRSHKLFSFSHEKVVIEMDKVTIIFKPFLAGESIVTYIVKQIADVQADFGFYYGTLKISDQFDPANHTVVTHLKKDETVQARRIIMGLIVASQNGVDLVKLHDVNIKNKLEEMGRAHTG